MRHDRPAPINIIPEVSSSNRQRDRDLVPSSNITHTSRRVSEQREYDRNRREPQIVERDGPPRRPAEYPSPVNQIPPEQSTITKRHYDREPSRPHPSDFDRSAQDHVGQSSRTCLTHKPSGTCIPTFFVFFILFWPSFWQNFFILFPFISFAQIGNGLLYRLKQRLS